MRAARAFPALYQSLIYQGVIALAASNTLLSRDVPPGTLLTIDVPPGTLLTIFPRRKKYSRTPASKFRTRRGQMRKDHTVFRNIPSRAAQRHPLESSEQSNLPVNQVPSRIFPIPKDFLGTSARNLRRRMVRYEKNQGRRFRMADAVRA